MADRTIEPIKAPDPIDPTHCPTCLSGTQEPDPWYTDVVAPADA